MARSDTSAPAMRHQHGMGDLRADRGPGRPSETRLVRRAICRLLGHVPDAAVDEWGLVYVRCRACRQDLTLGT
ncbi:MAG TPA: hypothetical protein VLA82_11850 [Actinomycetota bacterium]|nr:hypothetical protein [Actinomycetota bacterium]